MAKNEENHRSFVKNTGTFHPEDDASLHQNLPQPSAAVPPGTDEHGNLETALRALSTQELRERAGQLAISGHLDLERDALIESLLSYNKLKQSDTVHH